MIEESLTVVTMNDCLAPEDKGAAEQTDNDKIRNLKEALKA
jgi:hypothetical protein